MNYTVNQKDRVIGAGRLGWLGYLCRVWDWEDRSVRL